MQSPVYGGNRKRDFETDFWLPGYGTPSTAD